METETISCDEDGLKDLVFCREKEKISTELDGETVILDMASGLYHGLNKVGNSIWNLVEEAKSFEQILKALIEEYEVDRETCAKDLVEFLKTMTKEGLISVGHKKGR